jgi:hypothetical protein
VKKWIGMLVIAAAFLPSAARAEDDANKKVLKDAVQGALTGAVAAEATKDEAPAPEAATAGGAPSKDREKKAAGKAHGKGRKDKDHKDKDRPHGWDQGKKTGWGDSDVPPGLAKKGKKK